VTELIINPGSRIPQPEHDGEWQNTEARARERAVTWLGKMQAEGMTGVELLDGSEPRDGRWLYTFRHEVTGATATLEMHGIDSVAAYERQHIFAPRVYWNGSSCSDPCLEDFAAPGFIPVRTFARPCHRCERPILGTPHVDPSDPLKRQYCGEECRDADAEAAQEQHYPSGVAT
jgi:hypothetical protein